MQHSPLVVFICLLSLCWTLFSWSPYLKTLFLWIKLSLPLILFTIFYENLLLAVKIMVKISIFCIIMTILTLIFTISQFSLSFFVTGTCSKIFFFHSKHPWLLHLQRGMGGTWLLVCFFVSFANMADNIKMVRLKALDWTDFKWTHEFMHC